MKAIHEQLAYMYGLERFGMRLGLETMEALMAALGNPERAFRSVHIGGTNGKGSTAAMTAAALRAAGYNTGLYTSPHLVRFNERIQINGRDIPDAALAGFVEEVRSVIERHDIQPTFFEFTTAVAFLYFARQNVDIAVVEVGLGGDLDATNVVQPEVAVITNIGSDHSEFLGNSKREIASHKAGIIKHGGVGVTGETDSQIVSYFEQVSRERGATLVRSQEAIHIRLVSASLDGQVFEARGGVTGTFTLPLLGEHQLQNAAIALAVLHELRERGLSIQMAAIQQGLASTTWPGRLQVLSRHPLILVDGAHNEEGAQALENFLGESLAEQPHHLSICGEDFRARVLVLAMKGDKRMPTMLETIVPWFEKVIVTEGNYEPMDSKKLAELVTKHHQNVEIVPKPGEAVTAGRAGLQKNDLMLITGSLYMIGEAMEALKEKRPAR